MNRSINILLGVFLLPTMLVTIYVGLDLPIGFLKVSGAHLPYKQEIFLGLGLMLAILIVRRSIRRWMGMRIVGKADRFKWNQPVSDRRKSRVQTYLWLEAFVMFVVAAALYVTSHEAIAPTIAFLIGAVDNVIFSIVGAKNRFRVGLSSKALIVADREVTLLYFSGLRKVSKHQQTIYFDYIKELQLSFPEDCIQDEHKAEFYQKLEEQMDPERVFFSKTMAK